MKNILYIGNKLSKHGYTATNVETLGSFFEKDGYQVFYASDKKNQMLRFLNMGVAVVKYRKKVDYVLIDTYSTFSYWYVFMVSQLCQLFKLKYIPILHGGNLPHRLDRNPKMARLIFNYSYKNVAPSGYLMQAFQKRNFPNLAFIPNTIDLADYPYTNKRDTDVPKLLWVRSFAALYNPKMAVDVLRALQTDYPNAELCMVGPDKDGSLEVTRAYAKKQNVEVTFTGRLTKAEWVALSKKFTIFINTTNFDNTPVSVIEAMCLGLPIVTTNVGGIPFLLEDQQTALLVDKNSHVQMVEAVKSLVENLELRDRIIENGRAYVEQFDWNKVTMKWRDILVEE